MRWKRIGAKTSRQDAESCEGSGRDEDGLNREGAKDAKKIARIIFSPAGSCFGR